MPKKIAVSTLNASTLDILNVIRQNATYDYQQSVPAVTQATDIPKVGEVIYGTPAFANQFINALVNRIALVRVTSATFNNPYKDLKKGYLEYGETIEDIFVNIAKVVEYTPEKGAEREFKRTLPDVSSAFYAMNWRVMYPVTIQDEDLRLAFLSVDGVTNLIAKIVDQVYTAAEYDEFLLFKYMLIKAIASGKMYPTSIGDGTTMSDSAVAFRGVSNLLPFMSNKFNERGVKNTTPKERQIIFMDAMYNASYDVNVLASAFNMDKADFMGRLHLIDDFTSFDNARFDTIRANSDGIEKVTDAELALLKDVKAVIIDEDWFQVYDNLNKFTEDYVSAGLYWNYFYHSWKTIAHSPFANAVVFVTTDAKIALPATLTAKVTSKSVSEKATTLSIEIEDATSLVTSAYKFVQTEALTKAGIAVQPYGALIIPSSAYAEKMDIVLTVAGTEYKTQAPIEATAVVGDTITLAK